MVSLLAVRVVGTSALGAQSWINIGGFYLQPSEFAKLGVIVLLAGVLARHPVERPVDLVRPTALIGIPWLLVFIEPDLGSSLVFGAVLVVMLFWAGMPGAWVVLLISPLVAAIVAGVTNFGARDVSVAAHVQGCGCECDRRRRGRRVRARAPNSHVRAAGNTIAGTPPPQTAPRSPC